jgi:hypothetical protein
VSIHLSTVHVGETSNIHETFGSITSFEMAIGDHILGDAETVAPFSLLVDGADDMLVTTNIDSHCHCYFSEAFVETAGRFLCITCKAPASPTQVKLKKLTDKVEELKQLEDELKGNPRKRYKSRWRIRTLRAEIEVLAAPGAP